MDNKHSGQKYAVSATNINSSLVTKGSENLNEKNNALLLKGISCNSEDFDIKIWTLESHLYSHSICLF